ncbi:MAG: methyltransferase family protein [Coriobacteriia bacterium]
MSRLDLKVPPDAVALAVGGLMWLVSLVTPSLDAPRPYRVLAAVVLFAAGIAVIAAARVSFDRAGTTFNPTAPHRSSHLVTTGVYRWSRNPMYLGTQFVLLGLGVLLSNVFSLAVSAVYVLYMNRFQIGPEEQVLVGRFGSDYEAYRRSVRRWA